MNNFICKYDEKERKIKVIPEHRTRALWIKHLGLRTLNNIGRIPSCLMDCMNINGIKEWIEDERNITKERKIRA